MTNITENPIYEPGIFQIEKTTPTVGGPVTFSGANPTSGHSNAQAQQLANRTAALKASVELKADIMSPSFTGTVSGITQDMVGLSEVDNTADTDKPISTAQQSALDTKAPTANPTFTGTVSGVSKAMVGLGNVDNVSDTNKPVSTAQQNALNLKAPLASPNFTGTVSGITKAMVGLTNVDNTSDANKPVSSAQQSALDAKVSSSNLAATTGSGLVGRSAGGTLNDLYTATELLGSNIVPYTAPGGSTYGAKSTTVQQRLSKLKFVSDYDTVANGIAVSPNVSLVDPDGIVYKNNVNQQLAVFGLAPSASWIASEVFRSVTAGTHPDISRIAQAVELSPAGSGKNGPQSADYCMNLSNTKTNWATTTQTGEIDGLSIMVRQGGKFNGGVASDAAGVLINVGNVTGSGWIGAYESVTQNYTDDNTGNNLTRSVQNAIGVLDSVTNNYFGFTTTANKGVMNAAYYADIVNGAGSWTNFLQYNVNGTNLFRVDVAGRIVLRDTSTTTPSKTIRALNGSLNILNDAQTANILTLSDTGSMNLTGNVDASGFHISRSAAVSSGTGVVYGGTVSPSATAGGNGAAPAQVSGYVICNINNTQVKIPYYAN